VRRQLEVALLLDAPPDDPEDLQEVQTLIKALSPALFERTGIMPSVTGAGGAGVFDR
jgi:hypothetical protein